MRIDREVDVRYFGQSEGFTIPVPRGSLDRGALEHIVEAFLDHQQREFGYVMPPDISPIEFVTIRVAGIGTVDKVSLEPRREGSASAEAKGVRDVFFDGGFVETQIYERAGLGAGARVEGPAVVEQDDSTTVIPPGAGAEVDAYGNIVITVSREA
jgi:N-methylhydantoinase A